MSDDWKDEYIPKRWSKEDDFYSSGPVDPCGELSQQIVALEARLAKTERREGLLRAVAVAAEWSAGFDTCPICDAWKENKTHAANCPYKDAIDGGAFWGGGG